MKKQNYYTKNLENKWEEIPQTLAHDVIRQYIEKRYTLVIGMGLFIVGFLLGIAISV